MADDALLEPDFLRKLDYLSVVAKRIFTGRLKGEKRSKKRGSSVEFADFRNYTQGDDPRHIDWNTYARLERLFLKLFVEEEDLHVHILIDTSRSMGFGSPPKLDYARKVAAALGYVALTSYDRVLIGAFADKMAAFPRSLRGRDGVFHLFQYLRSLTADGGSNIRGAFADYAMRASRTGVVFVISDLLAPDWEEGLRRLIYRQFETVVVHVLAPEEVSPELVGDLRLIDSETEEDREVSISMRLMSEHKQTVDGFVADVRDACHRYGADCLFTTTDRPFEDLILHALRRSEVLG
jgi:uncharacterized protein (DUF58 family)